MKNRLMKYLKRILAVFGVVVILLVIALGIYSSNSYEPLNEMNIQLELIEDGSIERYSDRDEIRYTVDNPLKHILFIPGGLVEPESYEFLAYNLALNGYNVTIFKPFFNLAILTPGYANRFLDDDLENVLIGHSLGGVVGSILSSGNDSINTVILMGSYPIRDLTDKFVLFISAEHDEGMDSNKFEDSLKYTNDDAKFINIEGGNHAQFGWYGPQKGDGDATITTKAQQLIVIDAIVVFLINE